MDKGLLFHIDTDSPISVYMQIENQIRFAITTGKIAVSEDLPSVREMSSMLNVNSNTVTKAYRDLELMGLVAAQRGVGVRVTKQAAKLCSEPTRNMARTHLRDAVAECRMSGFSSQTLRKLVSETFDSGYMPYSSNSLKK